MPNAVLHNPKCYVYYTPYFWSHVSTVITRFLKVFFHVLDVGKEYESNTLLDWGHEPPPHCT